MLKFVFALAFALSLASFVVVAEANESPIVAASPDGKPRWAATQLSRRRERIRGRRGMLKARAGKPDDGRRGAAAESLPEVREIDAEGLKKLLERGEATAARPLLVNFWATWCVPCRVEFPDLVKIDADYRGRGLEFVLVSADEVGEIKTGVPQFLNLMRANLIPAYLLNAIDTQAAIAQVDPQWGGELPATFLFDARGQLVYKHTGPIKPAELRAALEKVVSDR